MASVVTSARESADRDRAKKDARPAKVTENDRDETLGRFAPVLMMPVALLVTLAAIIFYLSPGA